MEALDAKFNSGSSPRVRGTWLSTGAALDCLRFIPARAGNMLFSRFRQSRSTVHPRACGEHFVLQFTTSTTTGSSPRVRGTRLSKLKHDAAADGSSPRVRGTSGPLRRGYSSYSVHPRACGEHLGHLRIVGERAGSSPRVRGTFGAHGSGSGGKRFIPARAGNISRWACASAMLAVHPRACGEHVLA